MFEIPLGLIVLVLALTYYYDLTYKKWQHKGVRSLIVYPIVGSLGRVLTQREHLSDFFLRAYNEAGDQPYIGYYVGSKPGLLVKDPELIKNIMVKDFAHFYDHGPEWNEEHNPILARNLFNMKGHKWKEMRTKLSPTFTSGRIKAMFPLVLECADKLQKHISTSADAGQCIDIKDLMARYTTDVIGSCVFGIKSDSINDPNCYFREMGRKLLETNLIHAFKTILTRLLPEVSKKLRVSIMSNELIAFFRSLVVDVIALRARTGETRKDFMQLLIELKEKGRLSDEHNENDDQGTNSNTKLTDDDVTAQAMVFFFAGFETSSSNLSFAFMELARHPELQRTARRHIEQVLERHDGQVTYQSLKEMTYLDWILQEALRMYPPLSILPRICTSNYKIPGSNVTLETGMRVSLPIHALQMDAKYFPQPETFNPERFSTDLKEMQYIFMPFGEGPRQCIGLRFARLQSKLGLVSILRKFEVQLNNEIVYPLIWDPRHFLLISKEDIILRLTRVNE